LITPSGPASGATRKGVINHARTNFANNMHRQDFVTAIAALRPSWGKEKGTDLMEQTMERTVTLGSKSGLHARPAAVFVQNAKGFQSQITLTKNEKMANAKSILSVLSLGAEQGDQVVLKANGDDAESAVDKLAELLEGDLG
jgi:phosphotransferase system HPr (HPr) family protein